MGITIKGMAQEIEKNFNQIARGTKEGFTHTDKALKLLLKTGLAVVASGAFAAFMGASAIGTLAFAGVVGIGVFCYVTHDYGNEGVTAAVTGGARKLWNSGKKVVGFEKEESVDKEVEEGCNGLAYYLEYAVDTVKECCNNISNRYAAKARQEKSDNLRAKYSLSRKK